MLGGWATTEGRSSLAGPEGGRMCFCCSLGQEDVCLVSRPSHAAQGGLHLHRATVRDRSPVAPYVSVCGCTSAVGKGLRVISLQVSINARRWRPSGASRRRGLSWTPDELDRRRPQFQYFSSSGRAARPSRHAKASGPLFESADLHLPASPISIGPDPSDLSFATFANKRGSRQKANTSDPPPSPHPLAHYHRANPPYACALRGGRRALRPRGPRCRR
jgi:hypothetical protein